MKKLHYGAIAADVIALGLLVAGFAKIATFIFGATVVIALLASIVTGKKSNEGSG